MNPFSPQFVLLPAMNIALSVSPRAAGIDEGRQSHPHERAIPRPVGSGLAMAVVRSKSAYGCPDLSGAHLR